MPLLPAEVDHVEETPPASIFVIEVDVNHVESVHEKLDEELMENKDKGWWTSSAFLIVNKLIKIESRFN